MAVSRSRNTEVKRATKTALLVKEGVELPPQARQICDELIAGVEELGRLEHERAQLKAQLEEVSGQIADVTARLPKLRARLKHYVQAFHSGNEALLAYFRAAPEDHRLRKRSPRKAKVTSP